MSAWPDKFIIGLTGNIATGKSVVRKMLEHLGAYGIDADILSHRAIMKGSPGYNPVIETFGSWILNEDQQIDRKRLGKLAFSNPQALNALEDIVHPLVHDAVRILIDHARHKVIVIEAIKLLESDLRELCDQIWVTSAEEERQIERLIYKRRMSLGEARQRVEAQGPAHEKTAAADVVIDNSGTFEQTWDQVSRAWNAIPRRRRDIPAGLEESVREHPRELFVQRATPRQTDEIAAFIAHQHPNQPRLEREDVMRAFGEKAYLLLRSGKQVQGLLGWQVENLITRVSEVMVRDGLPLTESLALMIKRMEEASEELQSEVSLIFLETELAEQENVWHKLGYEKIGVHDLNVRSWKNAALETLKPDTVMYFKRLREDRILRPI